MAFEEDDPGDQLVGVVHLLDALLAALLGHVAQPPVLLEPVVQPVLADRRQLAPQRAVEILDDLIVALHSHVLRLASCGGSGVLPARQVIVLPHGGKEKGNASAAVGGLAERAVDPARRDHDVDVRRTHPVDRRVDVAILICSGSGRRSWQT
jgi:hypothetical protein